MNTSSFIAGRYFRSKKKQNFITILSLISMIGVAISTMALVAVMSVFNGLEDLIRGLFSSFDSELQVTPVAGKSFVASEEWLKAIREVEGVEVITEVIEDNALLEYRGNQHIARVKAVSDNYFDHKRFSKGYFWGDTTLGTALRPGSILGRGVAFALSVNLDDINSVLKIYYPKAPKSAATLDPNQLYTAGQVEPRGFFSIDQSVDNEYILVPIDFFKDLLSYGQKRTSLELKVASGQSISTVQQAIQAHLGSDFVVKNADEQHATLIRTVKLEKLFVFLTLTFILALASFNIFFSLSMLAIEKKKDLAVLKSMGAKNDLIRGIFLKQGALIALSGALLGLILGLLLVGVQEKFGFISLGIASGVVDAYPVRIHWPDLGWISLAVVTITLLASWRPAWIAAQVDPLDEL
ncbi:MAG: ABC transporter permease [Bacteroidetes bacterium]|nr:ABC transporter permease [Bacteroidota bacterium]